MTDLNMLNLEIPAERVLKPLWVQLLLVFLLFVCGVVLFCFFSGGRRQLTLQRAQPIGFCG